MHNYRSNQSALMTRCWRDFRHQYGIFGGESQTSFTRNATRARSEEGRPFPQATEFAIRHQLIDTCDCKMYVNKHYVKH